MSQSAKAKTASGMSGIIRKLISGFTGIVWTLFLVGHLIGNLSLYSSDGTAFNKYAHFLESTGVLLYLVEISLVLFLGMHVVTGIQVWLSKRKARPEEYKLYTTAGGKSKQSLASRSMIITGSLMLLFIITHVATFKYNVHLSPEQIKTVKLLGVDEQVRDLYKIVYDAFKNPIAVAWYSFIMLLIGFHLRHGIWSSLQSLGAMKPKYSPVIYTAGGFIAVALAVGFLAIPLYIYFIG